MFQIHMQRLREIPLPAIYLNYSSRFSIVWTVDDEPELHIG
jgi:hypothetical protein